MHALNARHGLSSAGIHVCASQYRPIVELACAQDGIASVRQNSPLDDRYQRKTATDGSPYFTLIAANGQSIGRSEMYSSTAARDNGVASVKTNGPTAVVKDNT
ncbi:YegP family protein [Achromobacter veterisilvae]|uniref:YegP family protein n=1 Tax=Achromobacter veterisilvae TaxID=2069367 RepID=A0ABZ2S4W5_9BURK